MADWRLQDLLAYRDRLLQAGIPYAKVRRQLRELRDHYGELRREALQRGLGAEAATAWAEEQLGSLREIGNQMLMHTQRRSLWHRYPRLMTLLLPTGLYLFSLVAMVLVIVGCLEFGKAFYGEIDFSNSHPAWLDVACQSLRAFILYGLTPCLSLLLIRQQVRQMVPLSYTVLGVLLLCALGSSARVQLEWPDPVTQTQGSLGASLAYGWIDANTLRLLANLLLSALGWHWWKRRRDLLPE